MDWAFARWHIVVVTCANYLEGLWCFGAVLVVVDDTGGFVNRVDCLHCSCSVVGVVWIMGLFTLGSVCGVVAFVLIGHRTGSW